MTIQQWEKISLIRALEIELVMMDLKIKYNEKRLHILNHKTNETLQKLEHKEYND